MLEPELTESIAGQVAPQIAHLIDEYNLKKVKGYWSILMVQERDKADTVFISEGKVLSAEQRHEQPEELVEAVIQTNPVEGFLLLITITSVSDLLWVSYEGGKPNHIHISS